MKFNKAVELVRRAFPDALVDVTTETGVSGLEFRICRARPERVFAPAYGVPPCVLVFEEYMECAVRVRIRPDDAPKGWSGVHYRNIYSALALFLDGMATANVPVAGIAMVHVVAALNIKGNSLKPIGAVTLNVWEQGRIVDRHRLTNIKDTRTVAMIRAFLLDQMAAAPLVDFILGVEA